MPETPDQDTIESAAVLAVRCLLQQCRSVKARLTENDKTPFVDGHIDLYSSSGCTKKDYIGKIDVQVKGTVHQMHHTKAGHTYPVDVVDLDHYLSVYHGVLYFCAVLEEGSPVAGNVYYAQLLPYDIFQILHGLGSDQGTVRIPFKPFPSDPREIERLLFAFHNDQERQLKAEVAPYSFAGEDGELPPDVTAISVNSQLYKDESITALAGLREAYVYATTTQGSQRVLSKLDNLESFVVGSEAAVSSGDCEFTTVVFKGDHKDGVYLGFEGVSMVIPETGDKVRLKYSLTDGSRKRYRTAAIVCELLRTGELRIDGHRVLGIEAGEDDGDDIKQLEREKRLCGPIVEILDALRIKADWIPSELTPKEIRSLEVMHRAFVEKKPIKNSALSTPATYFEIQGTRVYAAVRMLEDGTYELSDLLSNEPFFVFAPAEDGEGSFMPSDLIPALMALDKDAYRKLVNLDPERLSDQLDRYPVTDGNQNALNQKLLEMLSAYDEGSMQPSALLACAAVLAKRIHGFDQTSPVYLINLLQTLRRRRPLEEDEEDALRNLAIENGNMDIKAAAYALLGERKMAENCLDRCTTAKQEELESLPIGRFFKNQ